MHGLKLKRPSAFGLHSKKTIRISAVALSHPVSRKGKCLADHQQYYSAVPSLPMGLSQDKLQVKSLEVFYKKLISKANLSVCSWQASTVTEDATSEHHGTLWFERDLKDHLVPTSCHGQRHLPQDQGAQFTETAQVHDRAWHLSHSPAQMPLMSATNSFVPCVPADPLQSCCRLPTPLHKQELQQLITA